MINNEVIFYIEDLLEAVAKHFPNAKKRGDVYRAPDMDDRAAGKTSAEHLEIGIAPNREKLTVRSFHDQDNIERGKAELEAVGLSMRDIFLSTYDKHTTPIANKPKAITHDEQARAPRPNIEQRMIQDYDRDGIKYKYERCHIYEYSDGTIYGAKVVHSYTENGERKKKMVWYGNDRGKYVIGRKSIKNAPPLYHSPKLKNAPVIYFAEGEKDAETLERLELTPATTLPDGAHSIQWDGSYNIAAGKTVYIFADNDDPGREYAVKVANYLLSESKAAQVFIVNSEKLDPEINIKGDISDIAEKYGDQEAQNRIAEYFATAKPYEIKSDLDTAAAGDILARLGAYTLNDLTDSDKKPFDFIVDGMISVGLSMIFGPPKIRKSFLASQLAVAVASGHDFLNHKTTKCGVVYFDLEGNKTRTANRLKQTSENAPANFLIIHQTTATLADTTENGLTATIRGIHRQRPDIKLFIIDTLATARGKVKASGGNAYNDDVILLKPLHDMAISENIAVILVHHTRKGSAAISDEFDRVNGTTGLTGTCDNIIDLAATGSRAEGRCKLNYTPRDAKGGTIDILFDDGLQVWRNVSAAAERAEDNPIIKYLINSVLDNPRTIPYQNIIQHFANDRIVTADEIRATIIEHQTTVFNELRIVLTPGVRVKEKGVDYRGVLIHKRY